MPSTPTGLLASAGPLRRAAPALFLGAWAASFLAIGVVLMVGHWVALPRPASGDKNLAQGLADLPDEPVAPCWRMTHVLYAECRCSQRILEYLAGRPTPREVREGVLLVGQDEAFERRARERGLALAVIGAEELRARLGIESAPLLLIRDPQGRVRYSGGHTDRKQGLDYRDLELLEALRGGAQVEPLPVFGCAVSRELQSILDPIGIKYGN